MGSHFSEYTLNNQNMLAFSFFLMTILSVSTHAAPAVRETSLTCPEVGPGDWANFFPNEDDCGRFYMCDAGLNPVLMNCPDGLYWDSSLNVCNWPANVDCEQSGESSSSEECEEGATDCQLDSSSSEECAEGEDCSSEEEEDLVKLGNLRK